MNARSIWAAVPVAGLLWVASAQDAEPGDAPRPSGLERVDPSRADGLESFRVPRPETEFDADAWSVALSDEDLERRERSFERLLAEARGSRTARQTLQDWAQDEVDRELAWTSRLLLRELEARRDPIQFLFRAPGNVRPGRLVPSPGGDVDLFRELEARVESLLEGGGAPRDRSHSFQLEQTPEGVRVEVRELEDGEEQTKIYEAESLDELLETHPDLREHLGGFEMTVVPQDALQDMDEILEQMRGRLRPDKREQIVPLRTDILGVYMREPPQDQVVFEGLDPGVGLWIERTVPGTIGHAVGLRRGELLIEMNGLALRSGEDVSTVLRERAVGEPLIITLIDPRGERRTVTWKPTGPKWQ